MVLHVYIYKELCVGVSKQKKCSIFAIKSQVFYIGQLQNTLIDHNSIGSYRLPGLFCRLIAYFE